MQRFSGGDSKAVYDLVTVDENWIYCYDPETKRQFAHWVLTFEEWHYKIKETLRAKWFSDAEEAVVVAYEKAVETTPKFYCHLDNTTRTLARARAARSRRVNYAHLTFKRHACRGPSRPGRVPIVAKKLPPSQLRSNAGEIPVHLSVVINFASRANWGGSLYDRRSARGGRRPTPAAPAPAGGMFYL
ncbi:hypothetical protein EVAR_11608_1 [Eumeta japonica]|uniref:Mariner Mos1 transposase n=1 Tax=Eumeta variegata TaxID=151549 RepID=A0A4C1X3M6_EUMVA|nr:hypothetical protein EVAR_11608_1 [Eumeta japonica]